MALSPIIPTSFVPKQPIQPNRRTPSSGMDLFMLVGAIILGIAVLGSGGVFLYQKYLEGQREIERTALNEAEKNINASNVEDFIRLRDRFISGSEILDKHIAFSGFFDLLEEHTLQNVRFSSLDFSFDTEGVPAVRMVGVARSFNALAAQSNEMSEEKMLNRAIFSDITVNSNNTVAFTLSAKLEPELLIMKVKPVPASEPIPSGTASTTGTLGSTTPSSSGASSTPPQTP